MFPYTRHHPPTITLFPYTTLFRSPEYMIKDIPPTGTIDIEKPQIYFGEAEFPNVIANSKVDEFDYPAGQENMSTRDRKSTRLNSSHVATSYAVFCLKKKKKANT